MSEPKSLYTLIFDGKIKAGVEPRQVKERMAALFHTNAATIEQLFKKPGTVVKKGLTEQQAITCKQAIEKTGALCRIVKERPQPEITASQLPQKLVSAPKDVSQSPASSAKPVKKAEATPVKSVQICPKCGFEQDAGLTECLRCGVVFARVVNQPEFDEREGRRPVNRTGPRKQPVQETLYGKPLDGGDLDEEGEIEEEYTGPLEVEREGWLSLAGGAGITMLVVFVPFLNYIFSYLIVLVHELGHSVCHWLFGYPSIPAFDFMYGGGVAIHQDRQMILVGLIYLGFGYLFYLFRHNRLTFVLLVMLAAAYSFAAFTPIHEVISLFMGHGFELLFAGIFLYRAISGSAIIIAIERPLYAFLGLFIEFRDIRFAYQLMTSAAHQAEYEAAKGGGHWMDFSRIAEEYLQVDLSVVAGFFLLCCLLPPIVAFLAYRYRTSWMTALVSILSPEPE